MELFMSVYLNPMIIIIIIAIIVIIIIVDVTCMDE